MIRPSCVFVLISKYWSIISLACVSGCTCVPFMHECIMCIALLPMIYVLLSHRTLNQHNDVPNPFLKPLKSRSREALSFWRETTPPNRSHITLNSWHTRSQSLPVPKLAEWVLRPRTLTVVRCQGGISQKEREFGSPTLQQGGIVLLAFNFQLRTKQQLKYSSCKNKIAKNREYPPSPPFN